jgi:hypothetical protein
MGSVAGSFIAFARYIRDHWHELGWFPLWFGGMPIEQVYQPGLHYLVAFLASADWRISPARAYHFVTAICYSLGPVSLLLMAYYFRCSLHYATAAAAIYAVVSPSIWIFPEVRHDSGSLLSMRRLQNLVQYGDGPHVAALAILPLALVAIDFGCKSRRFIALLPAVALCSALVLTNWPGAIGLSLAVLAYLLVQRSWHASLRVGLVAIGTGTVVLAVVPWDTVSNTVFQAQSSNGYFPFTPMHAIYAGVVLSMVVLCRRLRASGYVQFVAAFFVITSAITIPYSWFGFALLPQPYRFQQEWEIAAALLLGFAAMSLRWWLALVLAPCLIITALQGALTVRPIDVTQTFEYRFAQKVSRWSIGGRVFAPGSAALWMNVWSDTPQFAGCCDASIPSWVHRVALHTIYTDQNATEAQARDASTLWLKAYGVNLIGVTDAESTEAYKAFAHPLKFQGLDLIWSEPGAYLYHLSHLTLVQVIRAEELVRHTPANGLDVDELRTYVAALERTCDLGSSRFLDGCRMIHFENPSQGTVRVNMKPGEILTVHITYHPRWKATIGSKPLRTRSDALGQLVVEPECVGECNITLRY